MYVTINYNKKNYILKIIVYKYVKWFFFTMLNSNIHLIENKTYRFYSLLDVYYY